MTLLRLGILGTGIATNELYWPELKLLKSRIRITAVANRTRAKAERFAKLSGVPTVCNNAEELFARDDVDAVLISLPIASQPDYVLAALEAGKHVLSEKPVAPSVVEGRKLVKQATALTRRRGLTWLVGEQIFFAPHIAKAKSWLKAGLVGDVRIVTATQMTMMNEGSAYFQTQWRRKPHFIGGFVVDGGVHLANTVRVLFGMPVDVKSMTTCFNKRLPPIDTAVALLRFSNGALGVWRSCFSAAQNEPRVRVSGSRADLEIHWNHVLLRTHKGRAREFHSPTSSFHAQFVHFHAAVTRGVPLAFTPEEAELDLEFMARVVGKG